MFGKRAEFVFHWTSRSYPRRNKFLHRHWLLKVHLRGETVGRKKKQSDLFGVSCYFYYICTVRREKSTDCKESILHKVWIRIRQNLVRRLKQPMLILFCIYVWNGWTNRILTAYSKMAWEYCFFNVHSNEVFGDTWIHGVRQQVSCLFCIKELH